MSSPSAAPLADWLARHRGGVSLSLAAGSLLALEALHAAGWLTHPAWQIARQAAEGATVGGLADWFAVSALFHRIPIPWLSRHTNIVVNSRARITAGIVEMVQTQWLSPAAIRERLASVQLADALLVLLNQPRHRQRALRIARRLALRLTEQLDSPALAGFIDTQLRARLADADWAQPLGRLLAHALEHDGRAAVWETLVRLLDQALASQSFRESTARLALEALRDYEEDNWWRKAKTWLGKTQLQGDNDEEKLDLLTARIVGWLREELTRLRAEPEHPLRQRLEQLLTRLAERLRAGDPALTAALAANQRQWLHSLDTTPLVASLLFSVRSGMQGQWRARHSELNTLLANLIDDALAGLAADAALRDKLDGWCKQVIHHFVEQNHALIGDTVRLSLSPERLPDAQLVAQIESRVGHELQWIRVNGALVGGAAAGLIAALRLLLS